MMICVQMKKNFGIGTLACLTYFIKSACFCYQNKIKLENDQMVNW